MWLLDLCIASLLKWKWLFLRDPSLLRWEYLILGGLKSVSSRHDFILIMINKTKKQTTLKIISLFCFLHHPKIACPTWFKWCVKTPFLISTHIMYYKYLFWVCYWMNISNKIRYTKHFVHKMRFRSRIFQIKNLKLWNYGTSNISTDQDNFGNGPRYEKILQHMKLVRLLLLKWMTGKNKVVFGLVLLTDSVKMVTAWNIVPLVFIHRSIFKTVLIPTLVVWFVTAGMPVGIHGCNLFTGPLPKPLTLYFFVRAVNPEVGMTELSCV